VVLILLVNIFMAIPLIGRLGEIKRQTIQASRYAAWERTVWYSTNAPTYLVQTGEFSYGNETQMEVGGTVKSYAVKSAAGLSNETMIRMFGDQKRAFTSTDTTAAIGSTAMNGFNVPGKKDQLVKWGSKPGTASAPESQSPGIFMIIFSPLLDFISWSGWGTIFGGALDLSPDGYYNAQINIPVTGFSMLSSKRKDLSSGANASTAVNTTGFVFKANNAILTDTWNAQGPTHAGKRTKGMVPAGILDNPVVNTFFNIWGVLFPEFGSKWLGNAKLQWGLVDTEPIPCDRYAGGPPATPAEIYYDPLYGTVDYQIDRCAKGDNLFTYYDKPAP